MAFDTETRILDAVELKLNEMVTAGDLFKVETENIKTLIADLTEFETPYCQVLFSSDSVVDQNRGKPIVDWSFEIEILMRKNSTTDVNQRSMLDLKAKVIEKLGERPQLGVPEIENIIYTGGVLVPHSEGDDPYYFAKLFFMVRYRRVYSNNC